MAASVNLHRQLSALGREERLPTDFAGSFLHLWQPLLPRILARRAGSEMLVVGLCGPQGSGKSTTAAALKILLADAGLRSELLALDDLYLGYAERQRLAATVHPLLATRGPPGTHDAALGFSLIGRLARAGPIPMPRFDKAADDRVASAVSPSVEGPVDILIFEGWCVGARQQDEDALATPINRLEAEADPQGIWRRYVNDRLATDYAALFATIDYQILLRPPSFEMVTGWRIEQEHKLRDRSDGRRIMSDADVARFVQHYERLSRHIDTEMPARADLVLDLDRDRRPC